MRLGTRERVATWLGATSMLLLTSWPSASLADGPANTHTVRPGESVRSIAQANGITSETILAANTMTDPDLLQVGQQLVIPSADGVLHTVAADETLSEIADSFGVTTDALATANGLQGSADQISVGMLLIVPGASLASKAVSAAAPAPSAATPAPVTQDQASATPTSAPAQAASGASTSSPTSYTVQDGDTLRSIADAFNLDILSLISMNGLDDPDLIRPGSTLRVSAPPKEYVVQSGDTLGDIAFRYSLSSAALLKANGLADPDLIVSGMTLVLPASAAAPQASAATASSPSSSASSSSARSSSSSTASTTTASRTAAASAPVRTSSSAAAPASRPAAAAPAPAAVAPASSGRVFTALITGYAPGAGASSSRTASGSSTHWGTVAADTRLYPFGTRLRIQGLGDTVFTVEDTGSAVRGNVFDVWFPDVASARGIGPGTRQVTILGPGDS
jgi:LysM repeat protein